ncbi:MAG: protein kinase [Kofleriaceae bacterium]
MIGTVVLGSYRVDRLLGEGGMGAVYRAVSDKGHHIAVKVMHPNMLTDPALAERFVREAEHAAQIRNPHIAEVMSVGQLDDGRTFIAMEFLRGVDLGKWMEHRLPITPTEALTILVQLAAALQAAHSAGIIHRDIKPDNLILSDDPVRNWVKIIDFGISKHTLAGTNITADRAIMGTPSYMAPEQAQDAASVTPAADIFAAAIIAVELITGRRPYAGPGDEGPFTLISRYAHIVAGTIPAPRLADLARRSNGEPLDIPAAWLDHLQQAVSVFPEARPQTARAFIEPLYEALPGGRDLVEIYGPNLLTAASPDDMTRRAGAPNHTATGRHTAPHATPTTFRATSGQVDTLPAGRRRLPIAVAALGLAAAASVAVVLARGGTSESQPDPQPTSSGPVDTGPVDAGPVDAGPVDAGPVDAGPVDASLVDSSPIDAVRSPRPTGKRPPKPSNLPPSNTRPPDSID